MTMFRYAAVMQAFLLSLVCSSAFADKGLVVGDIPPDYLGRSPQNNEIKVSDHAGKVVVISFWASWCPPCLKEFPVLDNLQRIVGPEHIRVFSINWKEPRQTFRSVRSALKDINLTLISDESGAIGRKYAVQSIPHMVIVGRDGKVASIHIGYSDAMLPKFADEINAILRSPVPTP